ncbi:PP2C family protein-serine/threonine phosphatase [Roseomonas xinghualingensis]|uniref:PP2C family protein-serine/threonine phosphatase n=1 Tax=Roseomonas xinghualingensis TaxID=2986475 RepID=UPI0021F17A96|nr:protein phosphatase 2C domain-containing protein [Roseomonas sp. SXEYE001]MCV4209661.1 protein phosphatase 2C domain-containing protein [Roseomonas sp. SXEYE001]
MNGEITQNRSLAGSFLSCAVTHRGAVRTSNQDAFVNRPDLGLWAVADGAGGHRSGEIASEEVRRALEGIPPGLPALAVLGQVRARLETAHLVLRARVTSLGPRVQIATTVVVMVVQDGHFACLWAGDSRAYLLRQGELIQVSRDHSVVEDLIESGAITAAQAMGHPLSNVVTRAVGAEIDALRLDKRSGRVLPGDCLLLCSDGLCKALTDARIAELLAIHRGEAAEPLVRAALDAKATDNVTAVTVQLGGEAA